MTKRARLKEGSRSQTLAYVEAGATGDRIRATTFLATHRRCAIVGLPGSGKTTLLQHLLLATAKGELLSDFEQRLIPVLVKVRQLDPTHLPDVEELLAEAESSVFRGALPGFLRRQFEAGRVLFLIDGLDEVVEEKRGALLQWIGDFVDLYSTARYVVSSRPA
jgi:predicted NACHT family NTPase